MSLASKLTIRKRPIRDFSGSHCSSLAAIASVAHMGSFFGPHQNRKQGFRSFVFFPGIDERLQRSEMQRSIRSKSADRISDNSTMTSTSCSQTKPWLRLPLMGTVPSLPKRLVLVVQTQVYDQGVQVESLHREFRFGPLSLQVATSDGTQNCRTAGFLRTGIQLGQWPNPPFGADAMHGGGLIHPFGSHIVAAM